MNHINNSILVLLGLVLSSNIILAQNSISLESYPMRIHKDTTIYFSDNGYVEYIKHDQTMEIKQYSSEKQLVLKFILLNGDGVSIEYRAGEIYCIKTIEKYGRKSTNFKLDSSSGTIETEKFKIKQRRF